MTNDRPTCVIDCRVSDKQQLQGNGLDDQTKVGIRVANNRDWEILKVFRKQHSATTTERDDFDEVLAWIRASKKPVNFYVCKSIDRFTRGGYEEHMRMKKKLKEIGVTVVDSQGIIQDEKNTLEHLGIEFPWSRYSPGEVGEMVVAYQAKAEAREILTRLISGSVHARRNGYALRRAPDGMRNEEVFVDGRKRVIRLPNDRAHYFRKMFEMRADGRDDQEIVDTLNAMGFKTIENKHWDRSDREYPRVIGVRGGNALTVKQMQRYIGQTEYAGVIHEKWAEVPVRAQYEGLVSIDIFNKANRGKKYIQENPDGEVKIIFNYSPWAKMKRMKDNPGYPWKCILCSLCRSEMLGSASRGKSGKTYPAYHCGGHKTGNRAHKGIRIPKDEFEKTVNDYLTGLKFEDGFLAGLELHLVDKYRSREQEILLQSSVISRSVSDLKAELAQKVEAFGLAKSEIMRRHLEGEAEDLEAQIEKAESVRTRVEVNERSIRAFRRHAKHLMEHPAEILANTKSLHDRRRLFGLFFEEIPTYDEIVNGTPKLSCIFKLSEEYKRTHGHFVTLRGIEPRFTP